MALWQFSLRLWSCCRAGGGDGYQVATDLSCEAEWYRPPHDTLLLTDSPAWPPVILQCHPHPRPALLSVLQGLSPAPVITLQPPTPPRQWLTWSPQSFSSLLCVSAWWRRVPPWPCRGRWWRPPRTRWCLRCTPSRGWRRRPGVTSRWMLNTTQSRLFWREQILTDIRPIQVLKLTSLAHVAFSTPRTRDIKRVSLSVAECHWVSLSVTERHPASSA